MASKVTVGQKALLVEQRKAERDLVRRWNEVEYEYGKAERLVARSERALAREVSVLLEGMTPRQRKAIEAKPKVAFSNRSASGPAYAAIRRRQVYAWRIDKVRSLEARKQPRIDGQKAELEQRRAERASVAREVLAMWGDPKPLVGYSRSQLIHMVHGRTVKPAG